MSPSSPFIKDLLNVLSICISERVFILLSLLKEKSTVISYNIDAYFVFIIWRYFPTVFYLPLLPLRGLVSVYLKFLCKWPVFSLAVFLRSLFLEFCIYIKNVHNYIFFSIYLAWCALSSGLWIHIISAINWIAWLNMLNLFTFSILLNLFIYFISSLCNIVCNSLFVHLLAY